ncbi:MAG: type VI secretion system baseplate subunit TssF [Polyangiales bacterium]
MFGKYYQDELAYLRELGREFAQAYPQLAPMLADRGGDPDVERLLEGVAFLTGRIRQKLDDELPEAVHALAELLFPQMVRPLPSAAILEITPLPNVLREVYTVKGGAEFGSIDVDGTSCRFRSCGDVDLVPWAIDDLRVETLAGGRYQLRVEMRVPMQLPLAAFAPSKIRFHLHGEPRNALELLMWLHTHTEDVVLIESKPTGGPEREISIGKRALRAVGFDEADKLLPYPRTAFPGFRLLEEYYTLPAKFLFVDVEHIRRVIELDKDISRFAIGFRFDAPLPIGARLPKDAMKLHCVPIVNIFQTSAEPIRLQPQREEFLVRPAGLQPTHGEVYAIEKVEAISRATSKRFAIPSFYDFSHVGPQGQAQFFYTTHIRASVVGEGADVSMSFGTPEDAGVLPEADVVSIDLLATNRNLASALRAGEVTVATPSSPAMATFKNLSAVTPHVPPPLGRELQWRVVAHAAMGLRSLTEPEVLRAALDIYNQHALVDRQAQRANELRLAALKDVRVKPVDHVYRGAPVRGVSIEVDLDEKGFVGDGDLYLFAAVLDRFFADYVSLNSFARTTVNGVNSKLRVTWPPRSGSLTLI